MLRTATLKELNWPESHWALIGGSTIGGPLPASESLIRSANSAGKQCKAIFVLFLFLSFSLCAPAGRCSPARALQNHRSDDSMLDSLRSRERPSGSPFPSPGRQGSQTSAGEVKPPAGGFRLDGGRLRAAIQHWYGVLLSSHSLAHWAIFSELLGLVSSLYPGLRLWLSQRRLDAPQINWMSRIRVGLASRLIGV